ncbi:Myeloid cell nuclear differentiation antigen [Tupaia chinensis]|uniref:Myeloid cell nuclear differentiation antigen n=1 Tax=Tupaia chinensis TaxID=246437 RepID=L9JFS0_TUPCH|nr:Myeloid cell nuclear differentiation antigen [Tupaia chinensis]
MVNEFKRIVLLTGLEPLTVYHFNMIKSLLAHDLQLTRNMQEEYDKIQIADLMERKFHSDSGVKKLIELFKDIPQLQEAVENLRKEKSKVLKRMKSISAKGKTPLKKNKQKGEDSLTPAPTTSKTLQSQGAEQTPVSQKRKNTTEEKTGTKKTKVSEDQTQSPSPVAASKFMTMGQYPPSQTPTSVPSTTSSTKKQTSQVQRQGAARNYVLKKGPLIVLVLKATNPFEYESPEAGIKAMFHATVATECQFFYVKVFNTNWKEKFSKKKVITIFNYLECKGVLEINEASYVSDVGPDQMIKVPNSIIKKANETLKIDHLYKQVSGTIVYGMFELQKKTVNKKNTIYEIQDNTGNMEVVGNGKWHNINCETGDKLRLFYFQLRTMNKKPILTCGTHSLIEVVKKSKKQPTESGSNAEFQVNNYPPNLFGGIKTEIKTEMFF